MTKRRFERLVAGEAARIPERFRRRLTNLAFFAEEEPTPEQLREQGLPEEDALLGLFEGVPLGEQAGVAWQLPNRIIVFNRPTEEEARERGVTIREVVRETIWHEVAHYLGMDESEVRAAEERRNDAHLARNAGL